jgi:hypothetical protein
MEENADQSALLEVGKRSSGLAPQIFPASEDHLMQLLLGEEHAHLLSRLLEVRAHMPFQVVLRMPFRFAPGGPDVEGNVLLRSTAVEFLDL